MCGVGIKEVWLYHDKIEMKENIRRLLWKILGIDKKHIQYVVDFIYLKEDKYTTCGYKTYDNDAVVYRWSQTPLVIGKYCSISYGVKFVIDDGSHTYNKVSTYPFKGNEIGEKRGISVGNDVWIGLNAVILYGVTIGNGATVAAGSVVTKDVPSYSVVGGVPAKVISRKCTDEEALAMNKIAWWDWDDDVISMRMKDFNLSIQDFIKKYS